MQQMPIDESLAFTALLEMDPAYRNLSPLACTRRRDALLRAWYAQDEVRNMWAFARQWLDDEQSAAAVAHNHTYQGQTLRHVHQGGGREHGYFEHPEDVPGILPA